MWAEPETKTAVFPVSRADPGKVLLQVSGTDGKHTLRRGSFWFHNPADIKNPKLGTPNLQKFRFPEIHFVHAMRRNSLTSTIRLFFKSEQK